jgi:hypothetical protein
MELKIEAEQDRRKPVVPRTILVF